MSNLFDQDEAAAYIERIEALEGEIATSKANHMNFARKKRDEVKEVFDDAKENGLPKKVLDKILRRRGLDRKIDALESELDEDHKPLYESLQEVFAKYREPVQQDLFGEGEIEEGEEVSGTGFEPDFGDPEATTANEAAEQAEGEKILEASVH